MFEEKDQIPLQAKREDILSMVVTCSQSFLRIVIWQQFTGWFGVELENLTCKETFVMIQERNIGLKDVSGNGDEKELANMSMFFF